MWATRSNKKRQIRMRLNAIGFGCSDNRIEIRVSNRYTCLIAGLKVIAIEQLAFQVLARKLSAITLSKLVELVQAGREISELSRPSRGSRVSTTHIAGTRPLVIFHRRSSRGASPE